MIDVNSVIEEVKNKIQIDKDSIKVNITGALSDLEVTENGIYTPSDGIAGFNKVVVNVNTSNELCRYVLSDYSELYDLNDDDWIYNDSLTEHKINSNAFRGDSHLRSIRFNKVTGICESAFNGCTSLTTVDLPACKAIEGNSMFYECASLDTINLPTCEIIKGNSIFYRCKSLTTVDLPACKAIEGSTMFYECASLDTINLPTCEIIKGHSFLNGCTSLKKLILRYNKVVNFQGQDVFYKASGAYIYVPDDLVESYKRTAYWSNYSDRIRPISQLEG